VNQHRPRGREVGRILRHAQVVFVGSTCDEIKYAEQERREYINMKQVGSKAVSTMRFQDVKLKL